MGSIAAEIAEDIIEQRPFRPLPDQSASPEAGFAVQFEMAPIVAAAKGGVGGRKIAWNAPALMQKFGMPHPGAGFVFSDDICRGDSTLKLGDYAQFMMEPEICAILAVDLAPRAGGWTRENVGEAVGRFSVAFEFLDRRGCATDHPASIIANNVFNAGICYDVENGMRPADLDPTRLHAVVTRDGETLLDGVGTAPQHPLDALAFLGNHFNAHGVTPKAGEVLMLGSHMPLTPVTQPGKFTLTIDGIGSVSFKMK